MPRRSMLVWPLLALCAAVWIAACGAPEHAAPNDPPPVLEREFRGAWVATVNNIDWPSRPGLPVATMRAELDAIVARAVELRLNALVFQVRAAADAFYDSPLEPWSEWLTGQQGQAPAHGFDPLAYIVARCHTNGLQLHAWFNPYRAWHPSSKSSIAKGHVLERAPGSCVRYGSYQWMDPGDAIAAKWSLAVIQDVVQRYDVDGVHIDDYFYPYPEHGQAFPDDASYARYRETGGKLARADWRRANIDTFVQRMYTIVHDAKPWVQVGISPFGIARPGVPRSIQAGIDQYDQLYADVPKWLREGWLDYLAPQLYWPIDEAPQSFATLLPWWHSQNTKHRHLWPGINPGRALLGKAPWRTDELSDQINLIRSADGAAPGHIHFSFKALRSDAANVGGALRDRVYRAPVLAPATPWLGSTAPATPLARVDGTGRERAVHWPAAGDARFVAVQVCGANGWRTLAVVGADVGSVALPADTTAVAVTAVSRTGVASAPGLPVWR
ncbi:MAG TPA: family 10 glycosylhydrolase [Planctomycetota bacterium]|nr:family 10 glycosylhydrolase [Planctomycetota bacterium]